MTRRALLTIPLLFAACSDPSGPCAARDACQVAGYDVAIVDTRIVSQRLATHPVTGLPVYEPGPITIEITLVNRGDTISPPQPLSVGMTAPSLRPGERADVTYTVDFTGRFRIVSAGSTDEQAERADIMSLDAWLLQRESEHTPDEWPEPDADLSNNSRSVPHFHVAIPIFSGTMTRQYSRLRAGTEFVSSFRLENRSRYASSAPVSVALCLWDWDQGCHVGNQALFARFDVGAVEAGGAHENAYVASMPMPALIWPERHTGTLAYCVIPSDHVGPYFPSQAMAYGCFDAIASVELLPDYEDCQPPVLEPGQPVTLPVPNCGSRRSAIAIDMAAGVTYQPNDFVELFDENGDNADLPGNGLMVAESGRYHIIVYHTHPAAPRTLTVDIQP